MKPWDVIGWIILFSVSVVAIYWIRRFILAVVTSIRLTYGLYLRHKATRDTPPEKGQIWIQDNDANEKVYIDSVYPTHVNCTNIRPCYNRGSRFYWGHDLVDWKERVYNRKMILLDERWDK